MYLPSFYLPSLMQIWATLVCAKYRRRGSERLRVSIRESPTSRVFESLLDSNTLRQHPGHIQSIAM